MPYICVALLSRGMSKLVRWGLKGHGSSIKNNNLCMAIHSLKPLCVYGKKKKNMKICKQWIKKKKQKRSFCTLNEKKNSETNQIPRKQTKILKYKKKLKTKKN